MSAVLPHGPWWHRLNQALMPNYNRRATVYWWSVVLLGVGAIGSHVAEELARLDPKPLLIAVTACAGAYPEDLALLAGFDHYLQKPADPFAIEALIRNHTQA